MRPKAASTVPRNSNGNSHVPYSRVSPMAMAVSHCTATTSMWRRGCPRPRYGFGCMAMNCGRCLRTLCYRLSQKDSWNCKARGIVQMTGNMLVTGENRFLRFNQSEQSLASFTPTNSQVSRASHSNCRAIYSPTKLYLTVYSSLTSSTSSM